MGISGAQENASLLLLLLGRVTVSEKVLRNCLRSPNRSIALAHTDCLTFAYANAYADTDVNVDGLATASKRKNHRKVLPLMGFTPSVSQYAIFSSVSGVFFSISIFFIILLPFVGSFSLAVLPSR